MSRAESLTQSSITVLYSGIAFACLRYIYIGFLINMMLNVTGKWWVRKGLVGAKEQKLTVLTCLIWVFSFLLNSIIPAFTKSLRDINIAHSQTVLKIFWPSYFVIVVVKNAWFYNFFCCGFFQNLQVFCAFFLWNYLNWWNRNCTKLFRTDFSW